MKYLEQKVVEVRQTETPRWGMTVAGYTCRNGAPTSRLIRLEGEKRFRRLMVWCFSNVGTCFVKIRGETYVVSDCDLPN